MDGCDHFGLYLHLHEDKGKTVKIKKKSFLDFFCTKYFIVYSKNVKVKADLMDSLLTSFLNDFNPL